MIELRTLAKLDIKDLALASLGIPAASFPTDSEEARAALIAETIRVGLYQLYIENESQPVHQLSLRNWVARKLDGFVLDLFSESNVADYRDVLLEGTGGNLEFLGDILSLGRGYLVPAPLRAVQTSETSYVLASGIPTALLGPLKNHVELTVLGRRLVNVRGPQLEAANIRIKTAEAFLGAERNATSAESLLRTLLSGPAVEWRPGVGTECYQGESRDRHGFSWDAKQKRFASQGGQALSLWRVRISDRYHEYWLVDNSAPTVAHRVLGSEWKRACIALDWLIGQARKVFIHHGPNTSELKLNFTPWAMFWRWMHLHGARQGGRDRNLRIWVIPTDAVPQAIRLLRRVDLDVKEFRLGDSTT